jgi:glycosyltransferase involved in cell wall biosynthesis
MQRPIDDLGVKVNEFEADLPIAGNNADQLVYDYAKRINADIIQAWTAGIFHTEKVGKLSRIPIIWRIGNERTIEEAPESLRDSIKGCAQLSGTVPTKIICNSQAVYNACLKNGYNPSRMTVIDGGVDAQLFKPDPEARRRIRQELGVSDDTPLIGIIARNDVQKDFPTFFAAAAELHRKRPDVRFMVVGRGHNPPPELQEYIHFLGERSDIPEVAAALDVGTSSSAHEATGNSIFEMMACGIPCVVTDIGIMRQIVGDTGKIVPPATPSALAEAWEQLLDEVSKNRETLSAAARDQVIRNFSIDAMVAKYEKLYTSLASQRSMAAYAR